MCSLRFPIYGFSLQKCWPPVSPARRFYILGGVALIAWALVSTLSFFPYTIGYFNELGGGPANGWRHLASANTDWSQGMFALKRWQERHPERRPLYLAPADQNLNPRIFGVEYLRMHPDMRGPNVGAFYGSEEGPVPGWHVISTAEIQRDTYSYLRDLEPQECIVGCFLVYYVTAAEAAALRDAPADVAMPPTTVSNPQRDQP